jgi:hypothetical protein
MKHLLFAMCMCAGITVTGAGCDKPAPEDCQQAIENMQRIEFGDTTAFDHTTDITAEVRRCRGGSSKESVACAIAAKTKDDLKACKFRGTKQ